MCLSSFPSTASCLYQLWPWLDPPFDSLVCHKPVWDLLLFVFLVVELRWLKYKANTWVLVSLWATETNSVVAGVWETGGTSIFGVTKWLFDSLGFVVRNSWCKGIRTWTFSASTFCRKQHGTKKHEHLLEIPFLFLWPGWRDPDLWILLTPSFPCNITQWHYTPCLLPHEFAFIFKNRGGEYS